MRLLSKSEAALVAGGDGGESHEHKHEHRTSGGFIRTSHTHTHTHGTGQRESQHIDDVKRAQDNQMNYDPGPSQWVRDQSLGDKGHHDD